MPVSCLSHPWVHLVLSLRLAAVWLRFHLVWRVGTLAWVEGPSVPVACLPIPWVAMVLGLRLDDVWLSSLPALFLRCRSHLTVAI